MKGLKNIVEDDVERKLDELLCTMPKICNCEQCRRDMASYALNRLKPYYVQTDKGEFYHKVQSDSEQAKQELFTEVIAAINIVGASPKHNKK